jgi:hypothetical protein
MQEDHTGSPSGKTVNLKKNHVRQDGGIFTGYRFATNPTHREGYEVIEVIDAVFGDDLCGQVPDHASRSRQPSARCSTTAKLALNLHTSSGGKQIKFDQPQRL